MTQICTKTLYSSIVKHCEDRKLKLVSIVIVFFSPLFYFPKSSGFNHFQSAKLIRIPHKSTEEWETLFHLFFPIHGINPYAYEETSQTSMI